VKNSFQGQSLKATPNFSGVAFFITLYLIRNK
jgi:hypothetical protein